MLRPLLHGRLTGDLIRPLRGHLPLFAAGLAKRQGEGFWLAVMLI